MDAVTRITLKAFLLTLAKREENLPENWHIELADLNWNDPDDLVRLNTWAERQLGNVYLDWCDYLDEPLAIRAKGKPPQPDWERENQLSQLEFENFLQAIDRADDETLRDTSQEVVKTGCWRNIFDRFFKSTGESQ
ncbi:hypothetical protein [Baaleninema simplex]|uniref:hypothetical protein n=1 Tax=Baaleninema simplex TaxID=2862350 RepID=UPI000349A23F|nr:hypothetical protein [Baaleninema simplex]